MKTSPLAVFVVITPIMVAVAADFDMRDEAEFKKIVAPDAKLEKLTSGMKFTEGPVWLAKDGGYLTLVLGRSHTSRVGELLLGSTTIKIIHRGAGLASCLVE